ncbi:MAG: hypothetical protein Q7T79_00525 [bacterium]|nr:hypothetical protein [bacterium]
MKTKIIAIIFLFISGCITLLSLISPINEYKEQGINSAVDCDSSFIIMTLNTTAILFIITAGLITLFLLQNKNNKKICLMFLLIIILFLGINTLRIFQAYQENKQPYNQEVCGEGL